MPPIYLDYNASTPVDPAVAAAMRPFLDQAFGNPSSGHWASTPAKAALERARPDRRADRRCIWRDRVHQRRQRSEQPRNQGHVLRAEPPRGAHRHLGHRASGCSRSLPISRAVRRLDYPCPGGPDGPRRSGQRASRYHSADDTDQHHACQQRDWHHPTDPGDRRDRAGARHPFPYRRSAVGRQDLYQGNRTRRRPLVDRWSQALRPERRRRALRAWRPGIGAVDPRRRS